MGRGLDPDHANIGPIILIALIVAFLAYAAINAAAPEPTPVDTIPPAVYSVEEPITP